MAKADHLAKYNAKRDFKKTREPAGIVKNTGGNSFLIQKHEASHLHYDFRLELNGTLKSWAVPKGPSYDPKDKRLAMQVEDHPVSYGSFEGIIPEGEYGGGTVMLWDRGTWEPVGDPNEGLRKGKLVFQLHGERMQGEWTLVRAFSKDKRGTSWLLIKHVDDKVRVGDAGKFVAKNVTSVVSNRTMKQIAADGDRVWKSKPVATKKTTPKARKITAKPAKTKKMPGFTSPQLATLSTHMPSGEAWVHEIKFDGYRMLAHLEHGTVTIYSRNGKDWTEAFRPIADKLAKFKVDSAILDGELVVANTQGKTDFSALKNALSNGEFEKFQYYLFDLLYLNGHDTTPLPLTDRKALLAEIIKTNAPKSKKQRILLSEHFENQTDDFLRNACDMHLEGVISKLGDAPYHSGRSKIWLKTKCQKRQEFVIGGYTLPSKGGKGIGSLLLGYYDDGAFDYAGRVGTGFTNESSIAIRKQLEKLTQKQNPYRAISSEGKRGAIWVKPTLVAEVEFTEWTPDGHLRHPSFKGLREDKAARDIVREFAISPEKIPQKAATKNKPAANAPLKKKVPPKKSTALKKGEILVGGIRISHPERIVFPNTSITKQDLAEYYFSVADHILPHVAHRPLSMLRCPEGIGEACFFQRHVGLGNAAHLHEVDVGVKGKEEAYVMIEDVTGLISLVQWGVIELHPWQCTARQLEKPDRLIFDLDPDPNVTWPQMVEAAQEVRHRMQELGLESFLKTTGGKGLHVVVPHTPSYGFATMKAFTRAIAESMAKDKPELYIAKMSKAARKGKIFVDYLRNDVTSTAVSAFSVRAREGATVSTPIAWRELTKSLKPFAFTIHTVPQRLKKQKTDPWEDFTGTKQKIAAKYLKALNIVPE